MRSIQIKEISKQAFSTFKKVRQLESSLMGQYTLFSKNGYKYIGKQLPHNYQLTTFRNTTFPVLKHVMRTDTLYLFSLHGQPLLNFIGRSAQDGQIKQWVDKQKGIEGCLWQIVRTFCNHIEKKGLSQILLECLRVYNGEVEYCYDSWMNKSHLIVMHAQTELQQYYFSYGDLESIRQIVKSPEKWGNFQFSSRKRDVYFRVFMLVLHLGTWNFNQRNYEYGTYQLNANHLAARLDYFCSRYNQKGLGDLTRKIIQQTLEDTDLIQRMCSPQHENKMTRNLSFISSVPSTAKNLKSRKYITQNDQNCSPAKISQIGKLNTSYISNISHLSFQEENKNILERSGLSQKKLHLKARDQNLQQNRGKVNLARNQNSQYKSNTKKTEQNSLTKSKLYKLQSSSKKMNFNLKNILLQSDQVPKSCIKVLKYLGLEEYVPQNAYEQKILSVLENIHIKNNWIKQIYQNGSIYLGEMIDSIKEGQGMYLFNSNDFYFGSWTNNLMQGYGTYIFVSGQIYEGELKKGSKEGHGKCTYEDGKQYEGSWTNNCKIGLGKIKFPNQVVFIGLFKPNSKQTEGVFIGPIDHHNKPIWEKSGILEHYHWQKNLIVDKKEIDKGQQKRKQNSNQHDDDQTQNDGFRYQGNMTDGQIDGYGIYQDENERFQGKCQSGKREGDGVLIVKDMFSIAGKWKNNVMVEYFYQDDEA